MYSEVHGWDLAVHGHMNRIVALTLLVWDYALTFEDERQLFWRKPYTLATYLFIWSRYIGIIVTIFGAVVATTYDISNNLCWTWLRVEGWLGITSSWSVEVILQLRIYALYDQSTTIGVIMIAIFSLQVAGLLSILALGTMKIEVVAEKMGHLARCRAIFVPTWFWSLWIVFISFECVLCCLAIFKGYERVRSTGKYPFSSTGLQDILIRDSVIYYIMIFLVYVANLFLWIRELPDSLDSMTGLAIAIPCVMGSRLMINVRSAHYKPLLQSILSPSDISLEIPEITTPLELGDP